MPPPTRPRSHAVAVAVIALLVAALGFALAVQFHAGAADSLAGLRDQDLIRILDDQNLRADQLEQQISRLRGSLLELQQSNTKDDAARAQAQQEAQDLAVLLGTVPATGPGVQVTITDPDRKLGGEDLFDVIEELRGAGAEAIQFGPVRVSTSTHIVGSGGSVAVDGTAVAPPYRVLAIGDPDTLDTALNIPGGVAATVRTAGGSAEVTKSDKLILDAVRALPTPKFATPSPR